MTHSFAVVTVCKNEEKYIASTIKSIANQSITPVCYVIVDDGSTDKTPDIIHKFMEKYDWIKYVKLPVREWDIGAHYAHICNIGFESIISYCSENKINIDYICLMDADTVIERDYFKKVVAKFQEDDSIGILSPGLFHLENGKYICGPRRLDSPCGTARCWSYKCFSETEGYLHDVSPDYTSNIRARAMGWKTVRYPELLVIERRPTSSGSKSWPGYAKFGGNDYHLCLNPILVLVKQIQLVYSQKSIQALGYLQGYLSSLILRRDKISDEAVKSYCMRGALKDRLNIHIIRHVKSDVEPKYFDGTITMKEEDAQYFENIIAISMDK